MYPADRSPFKFTSQLDTAFLNELFEGDMVYAATVFGDFLNDLPAYWLEVQHAFSEKNAVKLRSAVHKCKTLFGYVGHTAVLAALESFESTCEQISSFDQLSQEFSALLEMKENAEQIIRSEYQRLNEYCQIDQA